MGNYIPHTDQEIDRMLGDLGMQTLDELFGHVPAALRLNRELAIAAGLSEADVADEIARLASANVVSGTSRSNAVDELVCFAGSGAYDHDVASIVRRVGMRGEFVTAYTPYQAEVSQGVLQALFEYQTLVSRLFGLPIANASLYDGATAMVEAINLCVASANNQRVWMSAGVFTNWREVAATLTHGSGHQITTVSLADGVTQWPSDVSVEDKPGVLVVGYPNALGVIEDIAGARQIADQYNAKLIVCADPLSLALLKSPGSLGADVVVGEGQPFGTPLSFGGPYVGLFAVAQEELRRLPGRLVGETVDVHGRRAYVTTLRAREQDIRREKATSNVCTNQTLIAVAFLIQLAWLGTRGLRELALVNASATHSLKDRLTQIDGVEVLDAPVVREFSYRTVLPADLILEVLSNDGLLGGVAAPIDVDPERRTIVVSVTEKRSEAQLDRYVRSLTKAVA